MELNLTFEQALTALKQGKRVINERLQKQGAYIFLNKGQISAKTIDPNKEDVQLIDENGNILGQVTDFNGFDISYFKPTKNKYSMLPSFVICYEKENIIVVWSIGATDLLRDDYAIID